jgi:hypothetical protein
MHQPTANQNDIDDSELAGESLIARFAGSSLFDRDGVPTANFFFSAAYNCSPLQHFLRTCSDIVRNASFGFNLT